MKRLEDEGATVYMKDDDRDMINAFNNDDQLLGLHAINNAIEEDNQELNRIDFQQ